MKRLFECRRYDDDAEDYVGDWMGALLIFADDEDIAIEIFNSLEDKSPLSIIEITDFDGIIYNDYTR